MEVTGHQMTQRHPRGAPEVAPSTVDASPSPPSPAQRWLSESPDAKVGSQNPPTRDGVDYANAISSKQEWKVYMDTPARKLERVMSQAKSLYSTQNATHVDVGGPWKSLPGIMPRC